MRGAEGYLDADQGLHCASRCTAVSRHPVCCTNYAMKSFLIVTTRDLPEAYFLASALESRRQRIGVINITGRPLRTKLRVLGRLRRNRGLLYPRRSPAGPHAAVAIHARHRRAVSRNRRGRDRGDQAALAEPQLPRSARDADPP